MRLSRNLSWTHGSAVVSQDGAYRYLLTRSWSPEIVERKRMAFIMLNPSTADAMQDDPTIRRCIGFAKREGCTDLSVVNIFGYRATDPKELLKAKDPVGPENVMHIVQAMNHTAIRVAAWGAWWMNEPRRPARPIVERMFELQCLGVTSGGEPRHPLYVHRDTPLMSWPIELRGASDG